MDICHLILYELGIFDDPLDVQSLEKLEILLIFDLCLLFMVNFSQLSSFLQSSGLRCKRFFFKLC